MLPSPKGEPRVKRRFFFKILMVLLGILIGLGLGEILLRLTENRPKTTYVQREGYYVYPAHKNFRSTNENHEEIWIQADEFGLRNTDHTLSGAEIIVLGDSYVSAVNTKEEDTMVGQMRAKGLKVYNAGMDGFGTYQSFRLLRELLKSAQPRAIALCFFLGNDLRDNYYASGPEINPEKKDDIKNRAFLSVVVGRMSLAAKTLARSSRIFTFFYEKIILPLRGKKDIFLSYALSEMESYRLNYNPSMMSAVDKTRRAISQFLDLSKKHGIRLVLVGVPSKAQVSRSFYEISAFDEDRRSKLYALQIMQDGFSFSQPDEVVHGIAEEFGVEYISLLPIFRKIGANELYFQIDHHWNPKGQSLAASALCNVLTSERSR
jgi:hypothetical protein